MAKITGLNALSFFNAYNNVHHLLFAAGVAAHESPTHNPIDALVRAQAAKQQFESEIRAPNP